MKLHRFDHANALEILLHRIEAKYGSVGIGNGETSFDFDFISGSRFQVYVYPRPPIYRPGAADAALAGATIGASPR